MSLCHVVIGGRRGPSYVVPTYYAVEGATVARALCLRSVMKSRGTFGGVAGIYPAGDITYTANWIRDYYHGVRAFPGYFSATAVRAVVDQFVTSIGGDPVGYAGFPAERVTTSGTFVYRPGSDYGERPSYDNSAYLALLFALAYDLGSTSVFSTHKAAILTALGAPPTDANGLWYSDPAVLRNGYASIGWGFEDLQKVTDGLGMASALAALAYRNLARIAALEADATTEATALAAYASLVSGLATLRRTDGFYKPSTSIDKRHVMLTSLMVFEGLCTGSDATASANAVAGQYSPTNNITARGGVRHLVYNDLFVGGSASGTYQNGGFWLGPTTMWVARALSDSAQSLTPGTELSQRAAREIMDEHLINAGAPYEWRNGSSRGALMNNFGVEAAAYLAEAQATTTTATLSGANGSTVDVVFPYGHRVTGVDVATASAETVTVSFTGSPLVRALSDTEPPATSYGAASTVLPSVALAAQSSGSVSNGATPNSSVFGGKITATVSSGSAAGDISLTFHHAASSPTIEEVPAAGAAVTSLSDSFGSDTLADYFQTGTWTISSGRLRISTTTDARFALYKKSIVYDGEIRAIVQSPNLGGRYPCLAIRMSADGTRGLFALLGPNVINVYQRTGGSNSQLGASISTTSSNNVDFDLRLRVIGTTVTVYKGTSLLGTRTATRSDGGYAGAWIGHGGAATGEIQFDDLQLDRYQDEPPPVPPGFVLTDTSAAGVVTGEFYAQLTGSLTLRTHTGAVEDTATVTRPWMTY